MQIDSCKKDKNTQGNQRCIFTIRMPGLWAFSFDSNKIHMIFTFSFSLRFSTFVDCYMIDRLLLFSFVLAFSKKNSFKIQLDFVEKFVVNFCSLLKWPKFLYMA